MLAWEQHDDIMAVGCMQQVISRFLTGLPLPLALCSPCPSFHGHMKRREAKTRHAHKNAQFWEDMTLCVGTLCWAGDTCFLTLRSKKKKKKKSRLKLPTHTHTLWMADWLVGYRLELQTELLLLLLLSLFSLPRSIYSVLLTLAPSLSPFAPEERQTDIHRTYKTFICHLPRRK